MTASKLNPTNSRDPRRWAIAANAEAAASCARPTALKIGTIGARQAGHLRLVDLFAHAIVLHRVSA